MPPALFQMLVLEDMLPAIAALTRALGTVAEIHLRMALIGYTADVKPLLYIHSQRINGVNRQTLLPFIEIIPKIISFPDSSQ